MACGNVCHAMFVVQAYLQLQAILRCDKTRDAVAWELFRLHDQVTGAHRGVAYVNVWHAMFCSSGVTAPAASGLSEMRYAEQPMQRQDVSQCAM